MATLPRSDNNVPVPGGLPSVSELYGAATAGLTILAAGASGVKHRIYKIILVSSADEVLTLNDGFGTYPCVAGLHMVLDYGNIGKVQNTAATALKVTTAGAANVGALVLYE